MRVHAPLGTSRQVRYKNSETRGEKEMKDIKKVLYRDDDIIDYATENEIDYEDAKFEAYVHLEDVVFPAVVAELREKYGSFFVDAEDKDYERLFGHKKMLEFVFIEAECTDEDTEDFVPYSDKIANCHRKCLCVNDGTLSAMYDDYDDDKRLGWVELLDVDIHHGVLDTTYLGQTGLIYNIVTGDITM